jgi:hypothetical protein
MLLAPQFKKKFITFFCPFVALQVLLVITYCCYESIMRYDLDHDLSYNLGQKIAKTFIVYLFKSKKLYWHGIEKIVLAGYRKSF